MHVPAAAARAQREARVRAALDRAVSSYNRAIGSLEGRVLVTARRFRELGAAADRTELQPLTPVDTRTRGVQAPELVAPAPVEAFGSELH